MDDPRFRDPQTRIEDLADEPILVVCPRCACRASVTVSRLSCPACAWCVKTPGLISARGTGLSTRSSANLCGCAPTVAAGKLRATLS